jgi:hypothetical protein
MLRRPGEYFAKQLEEGCSSTAFDTLAGNCRAGWFNLADRGSARQLPARVSAVP